MITNAVRIAVVAGLVLGASGTSPVAAGVAPAPRIESSATASPGISGRMPVTVLWRNGSAGSRSADPQQVFVVQTESFRQVDYPVPMTGALTRAQRVRVHRVKRSSARKARALQARLVRQNRELVGRLALASLIAPTDQDPGALVGTLSGQTEDGTAYRIPVVTGSTLLAAKPGELATLRVVNLVRQPGGPADGAVLLDAAMNGSFGGREAVHWALAGASIDSVTSPSDGVLDVVVSGADAVITRTVQGEPATTMTLSEFAGRWDSADIAERFDNLGAPIAVSSRTRGEPWRDGQPTFPEPTGRTMIVGAQYHGVWSDRTAPVRARVLDELVAAGVTAVRVDISWASLQPDGPGTWDPYWLSEVDKRLQEISNHGLKSLLLLHWAPEWSSGTSAMNGVPRSAAEFGDAAAFIAGRWQRHLVGIELLNEPDLPAFLSNTSPETYTALIRDAYPKIKAVAPALTVVAGAPTYVNTDWYASFYALGGADNYDVLGIHPYIGLADQPPSACDTADISYYPCNIANLVALMEANGDGDKEIWATEYGWSSHDNSQYGPSVENWNRGVDEDTQAEYLLQMQSVLARFPQVRASFWYNAWEKATGDQNQDHYGLLARDFRRKPAYYAMRCAAAGTCGPAQGVMDARLVDVFPGPGSALTLRMTGRDLANLASSGPIDISADLAG